MIDIIRREADSLFQEIVDIRRDLHRNPELSFHETRTSKIVSSYLANIGSRVHENVGGKGVVAYISGENGSSGKRLALRADMDALPLPEETTHNFQSTIPNVMHACGHDAHTSIMLGVAKILMNNKSLFSGEAMFIFQPAEEVIPGGAQAMLKDGVFKQKPHAVFGQHCIPQIPVGKIGFYNGPMMAAADELYISVKGIGGHGSAPHRAKDPVIAAVQIVSAIQTIISRNFPPGCPGVISITAIHGGSATNIIPNEVNLMGTLRTMNEDVRQTAYQRLKDVVLHTGKALGVTADIEIRRGYPVLINTREETDFARNAAQEFLGKENVITPEPIMGAEDFAYFLQQTKGSFWQLGVGNNDKGIIHNIHSSQFDIDEEAIRIGLGFTSYLAIKFLH